MFTGIITDVGTVDSIVPLDQGVRLRIRTDYDPAGIDMGASIAHSGTCLTVTALPEAGRQRPLVRGRGLGRGAAAHHHRRLAARHAHQPGALAEDRR